MKQRLCQIIVAGSILITAAECAATSQSFKPMHLSAPNQVSMMRQIAQQTGLTVGLEVDEGSMAESLTWSFDGGTREALQDGLRRIFPYASIEIKSDQLLIANSKTAQQIGRTVLMPPLSGRFTRQEVWNHLLENAAFKSQLRVQGCIEQTLLRGGEWRRDQSRVNLSGTPMLTLQEIMATTAIQSGKNFWYIAVRDKKKKCAVSIVLW